MLYFDLACCVLLTWYLCLQLKAGHDAVLVLEELKEANLLDNQSVTMNLKTVRARCRLLRTINVSTSS